jgi:hypothetical protein
MANADTKTSSEGQAGGQPSATGSSRMKVEPKEPLPPDRVGFKGQLKLLEAYAAASEHGTKTVSNERVSELAEMNPSTVSAANTFLLRIGFLTKAGREYKPSTEVLEYKNAITWNSKSPGEKLLPLIANTWFATHLRPKLLMRPMSESEAVADLGQRAGVGTEFSGQLETCLDYLAACEYVRRDGGQIFLNIKDTMAAPAANAQTSPATVTAAEQTAAPVEPAGKYTVFPITLAGEVVGELRLKPGLSSDQIEKAWKKLEPLKNWVLAQCTDDENTFLPRER